MSGFSWTNEQQAVFDKCGKDLLVTASAGSGKTAVIVERIVRYLQNGSLKRLIVITFTNAAAAELKDKLKRELLAKLRTEPQYAAHYIAEIGLISDSYIGTIDAFCAALYRKYFETIDGDPSLVCLGDEGKTLLSEAVNETLNAFLASDDPDFEELVRCFSQNRSLSALAKAVSDIIDYLSVQDAPEAFIERAKKSASAHFEQKETVKFFVERAKTKFVRLKSAIEDAERRIAAAGFKDGKFLEICEGIQEALDLAINAEGIASLRRIAAAPRQIASMPKGTNAQKSDVAFRDFHNELSCLKDEVKKAFDWIRDALPDPDGENASEDMSARLAAKLLHATVYARALYAEKKAEEGKADFADIERYALRIVSDSEVAEEIRDGTDFIFIDEYQDTNYLQEEIIGRIANKNVIMVGDPKQSIYRFRHAEPDILNSKRKSYYLGEGYACPLNTSFRTSQKILDFVNGIFDVIMTEEFGDVDYEHSARLSVHPSAVAAEVSDVPAVTAVFFPKKAKEKKPLSKGIYSVLSGEKTQPPDCREAEFIAAEINRLVGKKLRPCSQKENGGLPRLITYGDIAVLVRSKKTALEMYAVFERTGIPYSAAGIKGDAESADIILIDNFLKIIDNPYQDIPLAAVMLSFFGGFSETEILEIRGRSPKAKFFHEAVFTPERTGKLAAFLERLRRFRAAAAAEDVASLIALIMRETGFEAYLIAQNRARIAAVDAYVSFLRGKEFAATLQTYLAYRASGAKPEIAGIVSAAENAVRFMTVHTSKGLEFPIVFFANANDGVKNAKISSAPYFLNKQDGIAVQTYGDGKKKTDTFSFAAFKFKEIFDARKEEARLLYVALTRARYHLFVTGAEDGKEAPPWELDNPAQWIAYAKAKNPEPFKNCFIEAPECILPSAPPFEYKPGEAPIGEDFYFSYPFASATVLPGKVSVTELSENAREELDDEMQFIPVLGTRDRESGIAYHKIMELLDFSHADLGGVSRQLESMEKAGVAGATQADARLISRAAGNAVFDPVRAGCKTWREKQFMLYLPEKEINGGESGEKILVQGVIDLVIFTEEGAVLVDYKLTGAPDEEIKKRYSAQIELYALALERAAGVKCVKKYIFALPRNMIIEV